MDGLEEPQSTTTVSFLYPYVEERNLAHSSGHSSLTRPSSETYIDTPQEIQSVQVVQNGEYETWERAQLTTQYISSEHDYHLSRVTQQSIEHTVSFYFNCARKSILRPLDDSFATVASPEARHGPR